MKRQCWLNINTGEFSNSWKPEEVCVNELIEDADPNSGWKLIEFECLNDQEFEFSIHMKLR